MITRAQLYTALTIASVTGALLACSAEETALAPHPESTAPLAAKDGVSSRAIHLTGLAASAVCTVGGDPVHPFVLAAGFSQVVIASEPDYADVPDMNTQNETGRDAGRYVYQVHEVGSDGSLSVIDLWTGVTKTIAHRADWESLDPTVWTPWGTLLFAEESNAAKFPDPDYPQAKAGLVYEVFFDPTDPTIVTNVVARPAIGSKSHEGMRFDTQGNLISISERTPGYIFKFVPDTRGDLSSGQTYALKVTNPTGDRVGNADWIPLDRTAVQIDASAEADRVQATGYGRPEDVEIATASGNSRNGANVAYVAITSEHRVLAIDLGAPNGARAQSTAFVSEYVSRATNATDEFEWPDNVALDHEGNLFITEDPGGNFAGGKRKGDDIWMATPNKSGPHTAASSVIRFASLTDCEAEPTGLYVDLTANRLFVNVQHRGGDKLDKTIGITTASPVK